MVFQGFNQAGLPQIAFAASMALFPLMALFIWLDNSRYGVFLPLFTAGKCIGVFSMLGWSIIAGQVTIKNVLSGTANIESFFLYSYIFSMVISILIGREKNLSGGNIGNETNSEVE